MPFIQGGGGGSGGGSGTVTSVTSANSSITVATPTTTPALTLVASTLPGFEIGYDQITAPVTVSSTTEAAGDTVIACAAHTFDGAPAIMEFFTPNIGSPGDTIDTLRISLFEGGTQIGRIADIFISIPTVTPTLYGPVIAKLRFTPSAAAHTYTVTAFKAGTGNWVIAADVGGTGKDGAAYVRFTKA